MKNGRNASSTGVNRSVFKDEPSSYMLSKFVQNAFHQNLQQMRETARASILSLPGNGNSARSTLYDDANASTLQNAAPKSSGLRHYMADDASSEYDDGLLIPGKKADGRF